VKRHFPILLTILLFTAAATAASGAGAATSQTSRARSVGGVSNKAVQLNGASGPTVGSVKWRFQVPGQYVLRRPAVGPDGGVVVVNSSGNVYSLTSNGVLRWVVQYAGGDGSPSIGSDGTVYVASMNTIKAISPDGSIRWAFTEPSAGQGVIAGPTVGPDGNIYVISDVGGLGAFALSPQGQLLWSNPGNPQFSENAQLGVELVFGSGRLYAGFDERGVALSTMFAIPRRCTAVGEPDRRHRRSIHAATASTGDRPRRKPLPDRNGRRQRLGSSPDRPRHGQRALELLALALERHVPA
jgi:PQQ-like domain